MSSSGQDFLFMKILLDDVAVERALKRISHEIIERNKGVDNLVLIGVRTRGVPMAEKIRANINNLEDIKMYRDDLTEVSEMPIVSDTDIPFSVTGKDVILCDDVLFTGRTVRAAIEAIIALGRPRSIQLAVLIDRGHRELPIRADYVGKNIPTSLKEVVSVKFVSTDDIQMVALNDEK